MARRKIAHHRRQYRFYDEDVERIEELRQPGESDTDVIRRCLKVMSEHEKECQHNLGEDEEALHQRTLKSYDPGGQELLFEGSFDDFYCYDFIATQATAKTAWDASLENARKIEALEKIVDRFKDIQIIKRR